MKPTPSTNTQQQDALVTAAQIAQELQARYSLASLLTADDADRSYDDFWSAVDLIAEQYFNCRYEVGAAIDRNVAPSARGNVLGLHFGRCDAVAKAALVLGLAWAMVDRGGVARPRPAH